jgi:hypothetical protein
VAVLAQDADGLVVARVGDPRVGPLDRAPGQRGGQQQRGDHLLALGVKEGVGARPGIGVGGGEDVGEGGGLDLVGDVAERVPPPAGGSSISRWGSNTHTGPTVERGPRVASTASRLFEVVTTAPGASRMAGITRLVVLPVRGPAMSSEQSSQP